MRATTWRANARSLPRARSRCSHAPWPCYRPRVGTNRIADLVDFSAEQLRASQAEDAINAILLAPAIASGQAYNGCRPEGDARVGPVSANVPNQVAQMWAYPDAARRLTGTPEPHPQGGDCPRLSLRQPRPASPTEIAPEVTGHGLPPSKCEAYDRVYDEPFGLH